MIAGLEEISKGDVFIGERRVNDVGAEGRDNSRWSSKITRSIRI